MCVVSIGAPVWPTANACEHIARLGRHVDQKICDLYCAFQATDTITTGIDVYSYLLG
jgi:hypothetical protein